MHYPNPSKVVKRRGFTALELIIVLVVGFSIIALSASKMGQLFSASSTAAAMTSVLELYSSARSLRGIQGYEAADDNLLALLVAAKMVPKGLGTDKDGATINEWGGKVTINITEGGLGFNIGYEKVPSDTCLKLAQNLIHSGNFMQVTIGEGTTGTPITSASSVANIIDACKGDSSTMTFEFKE